MPEAAPTTGREHAAAVRRRPGRGAAVLAGIACGGALFGIARAPWLHASAADLTGGRAQVDVTGADAAPAVMALGVLALATSLVISLASPRSRVITGPLLALSGIGAVIGILGLLTDPAPHARSAVARATGLAGSATTVSTTPWPLVALAPALALIALGVLVVLYGGRWRRSDRFDRPEDVPEPSRTARSEGADAPSTEPSAEPIDPLEDPAVAWDALSRGDDPSEPTWHNDRRTPRPAPEVE